MSAAGEQAMSAAAHRRGMRLRSLYRFRRSWLSVVGFAIMCALAYVAIIGPWVVPYPSHVLGEVQTSASFRPPSAEYYFGTNALGQDVFSLVIAGARVSLFAGVAVVVSAAFIGTVIGAVAGYFGGLVDRALMAFTDLMLTLPSLILSMAIAAALGPGLLNTILALAVSWWPGFARLVRGEVLVKKEEVFVQAVEALGAGSYRIIRRHVVPNIISPIIVKMSMDIGYAILAVAALGFIGIGVKPPAPEWGSLIAVARGDMPTFWWTAVFPGIAIFLAVFGFNLLGDGIRDVLDPKARR